ncbi:hypothetical protein RFI_30483 [Reticulomyxa filosa]|uniref:Uncharacterized protein n=1 Tax=Reticulomyxa filosa TaxID=46433 RepID=X6LYD6_RETFI|nr:hypothetical protein RFI_30483 [Reticulomyxa filosa]|eukprot:ETO06908.1 hypothetical protein RFI_30483 [Reticulomyxa filosa]
MILGLRQTFKSFTFFTFKLVFISRSEKIINKKIFEQIQIFKEIIFVVPELSLFSNNKFSFILYHFTILYGLIKNSKFEMTCYKRCTYNKIDYITTRKISDSPDVNWDVVKYSLINFGQFKGRAGHLHFGSDESKESCKATKLQIIENEKEILKIDFAINGVNTCKRRWKKGENDKFFTLVKERNNQILFYNNCDKPLWILSIRICGNSNGSCDSRFDKCNNPVIGAVRQTEDDTFIVYLRIEKKNIMNKSKSQYYNNIIEKSEVTLLIKKTLLKHNLLLKNFVGILYPESIPKDVQKKRKINETYTNIMGFTVVPVNKKNACIYKIYFIFVFCKQNSKKIKKLDTCFPVLFGTEYLWVCDQMPTNDIILNEDTVRDI